jgi:hypothetical protein
MTEILTMILSTRRSLALAALVAIGCIAMLHRARTDFAGQESTSTLVRPSRPESRPSTSGQTARVASSPRDEACSSKASPADTATRLVADALSDDPKARTAAIIGLADVPKSQAIPALHRVLVSGGPAEEQQMALHALRTLAQDQGDADGGIREVLRQAVYHGNHEDVVLAAQVVLDSVDGDQSRNARPAAAQ